MLTTEGAVQDSTDMPRRTGRYLRVHGVVSSRGNEAPGGTIWEI